MKSAAQPAAYALKRTAPPISCPSAQDSLRTRRARGGSGEVHPGFGL